MVLFAGGYNIRQAFAAAKSFPYWIKPALAGFIVGMVGFVLPLALGAGNQAIEALLYHQLSWDVIVVLLVVRFVLTPSPLMVIKSESLYQAYFKMNDSGKNYAFVIDNGHKLLGILQRSRIERYEA